MIRIGLIGDGCPMAVMATGADVKLRPQTLSGCDGATATTAEEEPLSEGPALSPKKKRPHRQVEEQEEEDQEKWKAKASAAWNSDAKQRLLYVGLIVASLCQGAYCVLDRTPSNIVVRTGEEFQMPCGTNVTNRRVKCEPFWTGYSINKTLESCVSGNFSNVTGLLTLFIKAGKEVAGKCTCLEPGTLQKHTSEVIVINGVPNCILSANELYFVVECNFTVWGRWEPTVTWTGHGKRGSKNLTADATTYWSDGDFFFSVTVSKKSDITKIGFDLRFTRTGKMTDTDAVNSPDYSSCQNFTLTSGGTTLRNNIVFVIPLILKLLY